MRRLFASLIQRRTLAFQLLALVVGGALAAGAVMFGLMRMLFPVDPDTGALPLATGAMAILLLLLIVMIPRILRPLTRLGETVGTVVRQQDYAIRAPQVSARDLNQLAGAFNQLLDQIQQRDRSLARELAEKSEAQLRLSRLAHFDPVTGLHNRHYFHQSVERALAGHGPEAETAVMFIDLDDFKQVNDSLGHAAGDTLLREVARRIASSLRKSDIVCRLGGDEFAVILPVTDGAHEAGNVAAKLRASLAMPVRIDNHEMFVGASIGVALTSAGSIDPVELLRRADVAMYEAKSAGKGIYRIFEDEMTVRASRRAGITQRLRGAIDSQSLRLVYQPQVDLRDERIVRVEALLRWDDAEFGSVSPAEFIRVAEETGTIHALGQWALERACQDSVTLGARIGRTIPFAVNVSMRQLCDPGFADMVENALVRHRLDGHLLELEVTESSLFSDWGGAQDQLTRLRALGIGMAVDDFGSGFTSLRSLRRLPLQRLKIDAGFIANVPADAADCAIVRAIVGLAEQLGLDVVAEGVETTAQRDLLRSLGCAAGQGYLFHRPMDLEGLATQLAAQAGRNALPA